MRLTALSVCGTLLAFFSLFWTTADSEEGDFLGDHEFRPCAATLRPDGPCGQSQDGSTCPYLFSLPPLTFHFPKQLRELEKIVEDLQELKDNVDQLRRMCADCTVSQTEKNCGKQREREYDDVNEGTGRHRDERDWLLEKKPEIHKNVSQECGTDRVKTERTIERDADIDSEKRKKLEKKEGNKWDTDRGSDKKVIKDNEKEVVEKDGKTQTDEEKDKPGQSKVPAGSENERPGDMERKKVVDKYNRKTVTDVSKRKDGKDNSQSNPEGTLERGKDRMITSYIKHKEKIEDSEHYVWQNETKETGERTQTEEDRGSDGIKMSEGRNEHTNKERGQHREERRKEMEKGIKVERNNEEPKQTESIGRAEKERTIKEGAVEEDREMGKEIKTEGEKTVQSLQRDGDGELESSKSTEGTDFVSISPTDSIISAAPRHDSTDLNEAITITSSLPHPPVSKSTPHLITDVDQGEKITADGPILRTDLRGGDTSEQASPDAEADLRSTRRPTTATTISAEGGLRQQRPSITTWSTSTTSTQLGSGNQGWVKSTTAPYQTLYTTTSPGVSDRSRWAAKRNTSSSAKPGVKPLPRPAPKPSGRIKPEADQRLKNPKNANKPDQAPLPDKPITSDQRKKPYQRKTTGQKSKTVKDPVWVQRQKPKQIPSSDDLPTDGNLSNIQIPERDQENATNGNQTLSQKTKTQPKSLSPVLRPTSDQRPGSENTTGSQNNPLTDLDPPSVVQVIDHDLKPEEKLSKPIKTDKPDQEQKPWEESESEEIPDQRSTLDHHLSPEEPERGETTSFTPNSHQKPLTTQSSDEDPLKTIKDSVPGKTPDRTPIKPSSQRPKPSQKIPKINQKPKPGQVPKPAPQNPKRVPGQKIKPNIKQKPDQTKTNSGLKPAQPDQMPNLHTKSVFTSSGENKTLIQSTSPRHRTQTRPTITPGEAPAEKLKPAVRPKPSSKIKTDPFKTSGVSTGRVQNSQTDLPPTSDHEVSHFPAGTKVKPKNQDHGIKTNTQGPKTSTSVKTEPFPRVQSHSEGFTMGPNSRITSDLRPKKASQPTPIEMTTKLNKIMHGILPSVETSTDPGSTKPNQASESDSGQKAHNGHETASRPPDPENMAVPGPPPIAHTDSTSTSDPRSTTPATFASKYPADELTTPSARELRVKINQVAAFLNNSLSPNKGADRRLTEDSSRSDRTDSKKPTLTQSKVNMRRDCSDHMLRGGKDSGVYVVTPDLRSRSFTVFCDMEEEGGGWTLLQRRQDGSVSFNRTWAEYRSGFGEINRGEFWLGNHQIHLLTRDRDMMLRVELEDFTGVMEYAEYEHFRVASERMRFRLTVGGYSGTAGDALRFSKTYDHNNRSFTTPDRDYDRYPSGNCGAYYSSGWWFDACMAANLNGRYYTGKYKGVRDGIFWGTWHNISTEYYPTNDRQSFKSVRMMIRPKGFTT